MPYHLATPQREALLTPTCAAVQGVNSKKSRNFIQNIWVQFLYSVELIPLPPRPARWYQKTRPARKNRTNTEQ